MRTFIALELPTAFAYDVSVLAQRLSRVIDARFVDRENHHITLAFLGDIDEAQSSTAIAAMNAAIGFAKPVPLTCTGLGKFGRRSDATLWLGIKNVPELEKLVTGLRGLLDRRGIEFDNREFKPHVTLARRARLTNIELPALPFPDDGIATKVTLFKSELSREGAHYKPLYSIELSGSHLNWLKQDDSER